MRDLGGMNKVQLFKFLLYQKSLTSDERLYLAVIEIKSKNTDDDLRFIKSLAKKYNLEFPE